MMIDYPDFLEDAVLQNDSSSDFKERVLNDYWLACVSRECSLLGRKEVLTGKAKFGILGDGKEIPQLALSHFFKKGDFRSGYYRDQTWMFALGLCNVQQYFAQLYADPENDPFSGGRQMNNHFATPLKDDDDNWLRHTEMYNVTSDISSTGGQMARALGLATASRKFRKIKELDPEKQFSNKGNEIVFCSIGDASTSEGIFWETLNAAAVSKLPLCIVIWDDGYGISVPVELQTTKRSISKAAEGFLLDQNGDGIHIATAKAWDYTELVNVFDRVTHKIRKEHRPALIHIKECTQPQGHSTSGSHERYKSKDRLAWEEEYDGIKKMGEWMVEKGIIDAESIEKIKSQAKNYVRQESKEAWKKFTSKTKQKRAELANIYQAFSSELDIRDLKQDLSSMLQPTLGEIFSNARALKQRLYLLGLDIPSKLEEFVNEAAEYGERIYNSHLYSSSSKSALAVPVIAPSYSDDSETLNGYQVINKFFDIAFEKYPKAFAFGEDVGNIGDVNQGFAGLQEKYGSERIFDTGIREWSIMGQAIGMSMRGLRPIAEIQYLDYLIYGLAPLTDDLATIRYRSANLQMAPAIIRTRGHRLEGIWHAGSPLGMILNSLRGMYVCVPRNFVQAAGMYNTLLQSSDPGIVIEVLNSYRQKETLPDNIGEYTVPLGVPEIINEGSDLTVVTYGCNVRYAMEAIKRLEYLPETIELIDIQTLLPFDTEKIILGSLKKTNRILFVDEDVPGGATSYMMQQVLEAQGGFYHLDAKPATLTSSEHRTPFGSDGDYFAKPQVVDIVDAILKVLSE